MGLMGVVFLTIGVIAAAAAIAAALTIMSVAVLDQRAQNPPVVVARVSATAEQPSPADSIQGVQYNLIISPTFQNMTSKVVTAVGFQCEIYNTFGQLLETRVQNVEQETSNIPLLMAGAVRTTQGRLSVTDTNWSKGMLSVTQVKFNDGTSWTRPAK